MMLSDDLIGYAFGLGVSALLFAGAGYVAVHAYIALLQAGVL